MREEIFVDVALAEKIIIEHLENGEHIIKLLRREIGGEPVSINKATKYLWLLNGYIFGSGIVKI